MQSTAIQEAGIITWRSIVIMITAIGLDIIRTDSLKIFGDYISGTDRFLKIDSTVTNLDTTSDEKLTDKFSVDSVITGPGMDNPPDPFKGMGKLAWPKKYFDH
jgi:hypothetical protein